MVWNDLEWYGMVRNDTECYGMLWNATEYYGMVWNERVMLKHSRNSDLLKNLKGNYLFFQIGGRGVPPQKQTSRCFPVLIPVEKPGQTFDGKSIPFLFC